MEDSAYLVDCGVSSSVRKKPGSTSIVRIPNGATSGASDSIQPSTPNFDAAYALVNSPPSRPAVEEIVTTRPERCARITGSAARVTLTGPKNVVSICARNSSGLSSSKKPALKLPALLTSTSTRPNLSTTAATAASASAGSVTSSLTAKRSTRSPIAALTFSGFRPVATTAWPAVNAALAMSTPRPRPAPVTNQTFLSLMLLHVLLLEPCRSSRSTSTVAGLPGLCVHLDNQQGARGTIRTPRSLGTLAGSAPTTTSAATRWSQRPPPPSGRNGSPSLPAPVPVSSSV